MLFKVGDRVKFVNANDYVDKGPYDLRSRHYPENERLIGKVGTVRYVDNDSKPYAVEFDEHINGHTLSMVEIFCEDGHGWYCAEDELELFLEAPIKPCSVPDSFMEDPEGVPDMVNHPSHYKSSSGLETLTVIKAFTEDLVGMEAINTAQVLKYVCRWKKKNGLEDLKKARFYLNDLIDTIENNKKGA